jgi:CBS domain containing-hemolysin-like protein
VTLFITLLILVVLGSACCSGCEAALFAVSHSKVELFHQQKRRGSLALYKIKEKLSRPITALVVCNNVFNIVGSIYVGYVAAHLFGDAALGFISAGLTLLIIVFGEIVPKTIGSNHAETVALIAAPIILFLTYLLFPIVWFFERATSRFVTARSIVSEEEIQMMSHLGSLEGSIENDEREMIKNVFTLNDRTARDIMTPRTVMDSLQKDVTVGDRRDDLYDEAFSRIPVYDTNLDDIVGVVYRIELLTALARGEDDRTVAEFVRGVTFVDENMRVDHLLQLFQKKRAHMAVVKNEFGGTSGVVTLEDVLEELVGEIVDETDDIVDPREEARRMHEESDIEVEK